MLRDGLLRQMGDGETTEEEQKQEATRDRVFGGIQGKEVPWNTGDETFQQELTYSWATMWEVGPKLPGFSPFLTFHFPSVPPNGQVYL